MMYITISNFLSDLSIHNSSYQDLSINLYYNQFNYSFKISENEGDYNFFDNIQLNLTYVNSYILSGKT